MGVCSGAGLVSYGLIQYKYTLKRWRAFQALDRNHAPESRIPPFPPSPNPSNTYDPSGAPVVTYAVEGHVQSGLVQNSTGKFARADSAGITAAAAATAPDMPSDFRTSITNAADSNAYPISSFTWLLVPEHIEDRAKRKAITEFLRWVLTDGQRLVAPLHYAPLPGDVASLVLKAVDRIQ